MVKTLWKMIKSHPFYSRQLDDKRDVTSNQRTHSDESTQLQISSSDAVSLKHRLSIKPASSRDTCPRLATKKVSFASLLDHRKQPGKWSGASLAPPFFYLVKATVEAVIVAPKSTLGLQQLVLLVQEVEAVVAWQPTDGELVGHFGPLLTICRHSLVQFSSPGKQFRQQPVGGEREEVSFILTFEAGLHTKCSHLKLKFK